MAPRRKAREAPDVEELKKFTERLFGAEESERIASFIEEQVALTGKTYKEILKEMFDTAVAARAFQKLNAMDLVACSYFISFLDSILFRRVYAVSPVEAVVHQADKYSEAIRKILESYSVGLKPLIERAIEEKVVERLQALAREVEAREEKKEEKPRGSENRLLAQAIDMLMSMIMTEISTRVSSDIAQSVAPAIRDVILKALEKGEITIKLPGSEVVKGE